MTTAFAERVYEAQHVAAHAGKGWAVYNPNGRDPADLPVIYGFNNGGSPGWMQAVLLAQDGKCLGGHVCSSEAYMPYDLGVLEGSRPDRREEFRKHYPDGYRMEFVGHDEVSAHVALNEAFRLNKEAGERATEAAA